jgi:hypothetical protein
VLVGCKWARREGKGGVTHYEVADVGLHDCGFVRKLRVVLEKAGKGLCL